MAAVEVREEIDIVKIDPLSIERERNRYASRAVASLIWLNGLSALAILIALAHTAVSAENVKRLGDAMLLFGVGSVCGLASAFFAYVGRIFRLERPALIRWRRPIRWLAILAAIAGAVCFLAALNMVRLTGIEKETSAATSAGAPQTKSPANTPANP